MFGRISYTFSLMSASWQVLKKDKELLVFPLLSGICCLLVLASFAVPFLATGALEAVASEGAESVLSDGLFYVVLFAFYICNYFVIFFFNSAVVACAVMRLKGGDPTVGDGLRAAFPRIHLILGWALVSATVGLVLRVIEARSKTVGAIVAGILGMAWTLVSFLAVPVLVVENAGPVTALKRSAQMLKRTWGEQLVGSFSFGVIFLLFGLLGAVPVVLGAMSGSGSALIVGIVLAVIYLVLLSLISSVLRTIFQAALYLYASDGTVPMGFDARLLRGAMGQRG